MTKTKGNTHTHKTYNTHHKQPTNYTTQNNNKHPPNNNDKYKTKR